MDCSAGFSYFFSLPEWPHGLYPGGWSPDGTLLLFQATESITQGCDYQVESCLNDEVYVVRADGTELTNLTNNVVVYDGNPTWSP